MDKPILLFGAGGHSKTVISMIRSLGGWDIVGIIDEGVPAGTIVSGVSVLGGLSDLSRLRSEGVENIVNTVGGIGNFMIRWRIFEHLKQMDFSFPTFVHPTAFVEDNVTLADGVQVCAQSYVSSESTIGFGTLINAGVIISHECHIGRCVNLSPGALLAGNVELGDFCQIGMGAQLNLGVEIGSEARVGNGATIKDDVPIRGRVFAGTIWPYSKVAPRDNSQLPKIA